VNLSRSRRCQARCPKSVQSGICAGVGLGTAGLGVAGFRRIPSGFWTGKTRGFFPLVRSVIDEQ